jgi:flagellar biosynthesis/type III secretory pathway protein FliH
MADIQTRILKGGRPASPAPGSDESVSEARARAAEIVATAEASAGEIREQALEDARRARRAAFAAGHADGMASAAAALARVAEVEAARLAELDAAVVEVALEIARRVVGREIATRPADVLDMARRALRAAAGAGDVVVRVAPTDVGTVREALPALQAACDRGALSIAEDPGLDPGEVVVETGGGRVDARVAAQLEAFRRVLSPVDR